MAAAVAWALYAATLGNLFYTHDGWNDFELGQRVLDGGLLPYENLNRLLVTLSFGVRALFGARMWAWHLPNVLVHGINAALVVLLAARLGAPRARALAAGLLLATSPLLTHAVEWVGGGYDLFATAGVLACALTTLARRPWLAGAASVIAVTSKEAGVMAPVVVGLVVLAVEPLPVGRAGWLRLGRRLLPAAAPALLAVVGRTIQVALAPQDGLAGRDVTLDALRLLTGLPGGVGVAFAGPLAEVVPIRDYLAPVVGAAWIGLGALLWLARRQAPRAGALVLAAGAALVPVALISMELGEMVENTRYLYLTAALLAPVLALGVPAPATLALAVLATVGSADRVAWSVRAVAAVRPVADAVAALPRGRSVTVLTSLYDEPTARLLMSGWLRRRGVRARYVMRGTGTIYARRLGAGPDAAQSYFGPSGRLDPASIPPDEPILLQDVLRGTVEAVRLPAPPATEGTWSDLPGPWADAPPEDPGDPPLARGPDGEIRVDRRLGPAATSRQRPELLSPPLPGTGPLLGVELVFDARTEGGVRYGSGYHERYGTLWWGDATDSRAFVSFEIDAGQRGPQRVMLDLAWDPIARTASPTRLGWMPLNYPGRVRLQRVRIRR